MSTRKMLKPPRTQEQRRAATRTKLVRVATRLFARQGYADTSTVDIAESAKLTRGALYYHFDDKLDLFRTVFESLEQEIVARIDASTVTARDTMQALEMGSLAFIDACLEPAVRQVVILDGPAVLGWSEWRAIDAKYAFASLQEGIAEACAAGLIRTASPSALAHLMSGALNEAVLAATSDTRDADVPSREELAAVIRELWQRLRIGG